MNLSDAERIEKILIDSGWQKTTSEKQADLIVVVACSVRQAPVDRIYTRAAKWQSRRGWKKIKTILTGCVLDLDCKKMSPLFDAILPIGEINRLSEIIGVKSTHINPEDYLCLPALHNSKFSALVPISNGCNNFCSYCAVPYVRGREVSRSVESIISECKKLIKQGYREIILVGQNVNSYKSGKYDFSKLLKNIDVIPGDYWLRFLTSHPKDLSDELIKVMARGEHVTPYLHLPVQSGDDQILAKMNRRYTVKHYLDLLRKVRRAVPGVCITTDLIVGFPGETKKQFANSAKLFRQAEFCMAYPARYSPRPGTAAAKLADDVPPAEKKRRWEVINNILKKTALAANKKYLGQIEKVLVDGYKRGKCSGKTATYKNVIFPGSKSLVGKFVKVKINKVDSWGLFGKIL